MSPVSESVQAKMACLAKVSYAERDYAVIALNRLVKKTGRPHEIIECTCCRGFHIQTKHLKTV